MNVSTAGAAQIARPPTLSATSEAKEAPGAPDNDGDADDAKTANVRTATVKAPLPADVGVRVDKTA